MVSPEILEIITSHLSQWKQKGYQIKALCPLHQETEPSFYIDIERGLWHCFGCQQGGTIKTLLEKLAPDAVSRIYTYNGKTDSAYQEAINFYESLPLLLEFESIVKIIEQKRKIKGETLARINPKWGEPEKVKSFGVPSYLNFAQRVIFPNTFHHRISSYLGYALNGETPKYYYPPRLRPLVPFGWDEVVNEMREIKQVYITEGIFDMLSLWQCGLPALSSSGNTITRIPALIPSDVQIILLPDNPKVDKGGLRIGVQWAISCLVLGRWDAKLGVFPSYIFKDANDALVANCLEEQIEHMEFYSLPHFLIHVAERQLVPNISIDFIIDLIARHVPFDFAMEVLKWVKKHYPSILMKLHGAILGYSDVESIQDKHEHWKIVIEAGRTAQGKELLRQVFLDVEIPYILSQEIIQDSCPFPPSLVIESAKIAAKQIRTKKGRQLKLFLVQLGFLPAESVDIL